MRAHLLVFNSSQASLREVEKAIDRLDVVVNWYAFFDNVMCLASNESAKDLSRHIRNEFPALNFIFSAVDGEEKGGWMPKAIWSFLNEPKSADTEAA